MAIGLAGDGVCVACIERKSSGLPQVEQAGFYPGPPATWASNLEKLAREFHANRYQCSTVLGHGDYQLLSVDAPNVAPDELKTAIRWRLKDMLDFHIDDATIDVLDIPADKHAQSRNHAMYAVAARNQLIEQRQTLFGNARIPLSVIDIPEMAQRNIASLVEEEGRGLAMLSFSGDAGLLTVTYGGELYLSRRVDIPAEQLVQEDPEARRACHDRITLELQRSLDHFDRQYHFITVSKLMLAPLSGEAQGLQDNLAANLYVPVESLNLDTVFDFSAAPQLRSTENQQRWFMTLGAALRLEEKVL